MDISNVINTKFDKFGKCQSHGWSNHLLSVKNIKIEKEKGTLSYQTVLASLACKIQHLNVSHIKITAKNIVKVFSLHKNSQIRG